jgi:FKBP-type peptidyl-prolyl cis-trans isomerase SlyD
MRAPGRYADKLVDNDGRPDTSPCETERESSNMKIEKDTVVTLRYILADAKGKPIEQSAKPMVYLHGGYQNTLPKIEAALEGRMPGYQATLPLQPGEAFPVRDEALVQTLPRSQFAKAPKVGARLERNGAPGEHTTTFTVMQVKGDSVVVDGNHPLAGRELRIVVTVSTVRAASAEELAHGHVHGEHGHHH